MHFMGVSYVVVSRSVASHELSRPGCKFKWVISVGDFPARGPSKKPHRFHEFNPAQKLRLEFDDVSSETSSLSGYIRATPDQIEKLIRFCRRVDGHTLIHCEAGISRSSACAIVLGAVKFGPDKETDAVRKLAEYELYRRGEDENSFCPNSWVIHLADRILGRQGRLYKAVGRFYPHFER